MNQVQLQISMIVFQELSKKDFGQLSDEQRRLYSAAVKILGEQIQPPTIVPALRTVLQSGSD